MTRRIPDAESTAFPWWLIIDPRQMMGASCHAVADMITGPFLSREAAQRHLDGRRHAFSNRAVVYCHSGYWSKDWQNLCQEPSKEPEVAKEAPRG